MLYKSFEILLRSANRLWDLNHFVCRGKQTSDKNLSRFDRVDIAFSLVVEHHSYSYLDREFTQCIHVSI